MNKNKKILADTVFNIAKQREDQTADIMLQMIDNPMMQMFGVSSMPITQLVMMENMLQGFISSGNPESLSFVPEQRTRCVEYRKKIIGKIGRERFMKEYVIKLEEHNEMVKHNRSANSILSPLNDDGFPI